MESFREDNKSVTIPLCRTAKGGYWSPNEAKHESDAAWQNCSAERRYLYVLPGTRFEISGQKMLSFDQRLAISAKMLRCRGKADCLNEQLSAMGIAPRYGSDSSTVPAPAPVVPQTQQDSCDQACLLAKLAVTGWKPQTPIEKITYLTRPLSYGEAHGIEIAIFTGLGGLAIICAIMWSQRQKQVDWKKELSELRQKLSSRECDLAKVQTWQREAQDGKKLAETENTELLTFLKDILAKDLGVRLESIDVSGSDARINLFKAFTANASLRLKRLLTAVDHLGGTSSLWADKSFADVLDAVCRGASTIKSELTKALDEAKTTRSQINMIMQTHESDLMTAAGRYSDSLKRSEAEHAQALLKLKQEHDAEMQERAKETERLKEFVGIKKDADDLRLAYETHAALLRGTKTKKLRLQELERTEEANSENQGVLRQKVVSGLETAEEKITFHWLQATAAYRQRDLQAARTDYGDMMRESNAAYDVYQNRLNQMEIHLGIPLSRATAEALSNETLIEAGIKRSEALALEERNLSREAELKILTTEILKQEQDLVARDAELDSRVTVAVDQAVSVLQAQLNAANEECESLNARITELSEIAMRIPAFPNGMNVHGEDDIKTGQNGYLTLTEEHIPKTRTMPFSPNNSGISSPFDVLLEPIQQFNRDAMMLVRPRLLLKHLGTLNAFFSSKYELGKDILELIDGVRRSEEPQLRMQAKSDNPDLLKLFDAHLGDLPQLLKNLPFLLFEGGGGNGRVSTTPSPVG
ncbi:hypothetical protein IT408_03415 [Candidatus Uhrbacteria bacterium]|nr:hypothetical protein [Candidatus Uhrbacteria bacterium]